MKKSWGDVDALETRIKRFDRYSYKLIEPGQFGLDVSYDEPVLDESSMAITFPFASSANRDGVGDLLEIEGINTKRHLKNPVCLFDHGKTVSLPIALAEDPKTKQYTVVLDPLKKEARAKAFFYQGGGRFGQQDSEHALLCEQLYDLMAKRYIRSGSIGYRALKAYHLPANPQVGIPQGLHLLQTELLEVSAVVVPANPETVIGKALSLPKICGKPISPYLVKSLSPYAPEKKVQLAWDQKAIKVRVGQEGNPASVNHEERSRYTVTQQNEDGTERLEGEQYRAGFRDPETARRLGQAVTEHQNRTGTPSVLSDVTGGEKGVKSVRMKYRRGKAIDQPTNYSDDTYRQEATAKLDRYTTRQFTEADNRELDRLSEDTGHSREEVERRRSDYLRSVATGKRMQTYDNPLNNNNIPPARWKPGVGASTKDLRLKYRQKANYTPHEEREEEENEERNSTGQFWADGTRITPDDDNESYELTNGDKTLTGTKARKITVARTGNPASSDHTRRERFEAQATDNQGRTLGTSTHRTREDARADAGETQADMETYRPEGRFQIEDVTGKSIDAPTAGPSNRMKVRRRGTSTTPPPVPPTPVASEPGAMMKSLRMKYRQKSSVRFQQHRRDSDGDKKDPNNAWYTVTGGAMGSQMAYHADEQTAAGHARDLREVEAEAAKGKKAHRRVVRDPNPANHGQVDYTVSSEGHRSPHLNRSYTTSSEDNARYYAAEMGASDARAGSPSPELREGRDPYTDVEDE